MPTKKISDTSASSAQGTSVDESQVTPVTDMPTDTAQPSAADTSADSASSQPARSAQDFVGEATKEDSGFKNQDSREEMPKDASQAQNNNGTDAGQASMTSSRNDEQPTQFHPRTNFGNRPSFQRGGFRPHNNDISNPAALQGPTEEVKGILDVQMEGHGFLRPKFVPSNRDVYISQSQIRRFMLRAGDMVGGLARPPKDNERYYGLLKVETVNGSQADQMERRPWFDDLTPVYPNKQLILSTGKTPLSTRIIDLVAPIGFGQRGMIVSPPKAGKTTIMKEIAAGIAQNFPQVHLIAALIAERPEEVTDLSLSVKGEVVASNFDESPENQIRVAEITLERAKRLVEMGRDVVILLDSITRLARAYNLGVAPSGRTLSGGFDPAALFPAKKFFGAARNCQEGGSLTIIGTALVETGSRMDDLIYEEFKGTGNMELHLERALAERRVFPAINIVKSGTREEQRILSPEVYQQLVTLHRMLDMLGQDQTEAFIERLSKTETNEDFLKTLGK